jgi:hypothetical protein
MIAMAARLAAVAALSPRAGCPLKLDLARFVGCVTLRGLAPEPFRSAIGHLPYEPSAMPRDLLISVGNGLWRGIRGYCLRSFVDGSGAFDLAQPWK